MFIFALLPGSYDPPVTNSLVSSYWGGGFDVVGGAEAGLCLSSGTGGLFAESSKTPA